MTLEECIEYFEIEAETSDSLMMPYEPRKKYSDDCKQMVEWLKELKAYRKAKKKIIENMKAWEKIYNEPLEWNVEDINSIKLAFYQDGKADAYTDCIGICEMAFEEVNADE